MRVNGAGMWFAEEFPSKNYSQTSFFQVEFNLFFPLHLQKPSYSENCIKSFRFHTQNQVCEHTELAEMKNFLLIEFYLLDLKDS